MTDGAGCWATVWRASETLRRRRRGWLVLPMSRPLHPYYRCTWCMRSRSLERRVRKRVVRSVRRARHGWRGSNRRGVCAFVSAASHWRRHLVLHEARWKEAVPGKLGSIPAREVSSVSPHFCYPDAIPCELAGAVQGFDDEANPCLRGFAQGIRGPLPDRAGGYAHRPLLQPVPGAAAREVGQR